MDKKPKTLNILGINVVPKPGMPEDMAVITKENGSLEDIVVIRNVKATPQEVAAVVGEDHYLSLVIELIQAARQNKNDEYRNIKKTIKQLMLENKEARNFFQTAFSATKITI